jgi:hypothetical protein
MIVASLAPVSAGSALAASGSCSVRLQPRHYWWPGQPFWQEHVRFLQIPISFDRNRPHTIVNLRTRQSFNWSFWDDHRIGVPTHYALGLNRSWAQDPWLLAYRC